jgi:hypothetical protein
MTAVEVAQHIADDCSDGLRAFSTLAESTRTAVDTSQRRWPTGATAGVGFLLRLEQLTGRFIPGCDVLGFL